MKQRDRILLTACAAGIFGLLLGLREPAWSYAPITHTEIGAIAVDRSRVDSVLKRDYGVDLGSAAQGLSGLWK